VNFEWSPKKLINLGLFENFATQTRGESADFPTSFIEFRHWMQKLQHFELDL